MRARSPRSEQIEVNTTFVRLPQLPPDAPFRVSRFYSCRKSGFFYCGCDE